MDYAHSSAFINWVYRKIPQCPKGKGKKAKKGRLWASSLFAVFE